MFFFIFLGDFPRSPGSAPASALLHLDLSAGQQLLASDAFAVALVVPWNVTDGITMGVGGWVQVGDPNWVILVKQ